MHCDAFPPSLSLKLSPTLRGLRWLARSAEARGQPPGPPLRSTAPQTPWYFWHSGLQGRWFRG